MIKYLTFLVLNCSGIVLLSSCNKTDPNCQVSTSCNTEKIDSGDVTINISYEAGQPGVPVILYDGYVEDNVILWSDTVYQSNITFYLPVGKRYAAEAYYVTSNQTIVALDGTKFKDNTNEECNTTCYQFPTVSLDCEKL
jgi:hypothetical protein